MTRPTLYVAATRGRERTHLYVTTQEKQDLAHEWSDQQDLDELDVLHTVVTRETADLAATDVRIRETARATAHTGPPLSMSPSSSATGRRPAPTPPTPSVGDKRKVRLGP